MVTGQSRGSETGATIPSLPMGPGKRDIPTPGGRTSAGLGVSAKWDMAPPTGAGGKERNEYGKRGP